MVNYHQSRQLPGAGSSGSAFAQGGNPIGPGQNLTNMTMNQFKAPAKAMTSSGVKDPAKMAEQAALDNG